MTSFHDPITLSDLIIFAAGALTSLLFVYGWRV